mmetsp:Transcript_18813/g.38546  ORF Transcript_18813/g.38546 Transcript_18813/m.38546 type:complete len:258 (+) Transcript_18813:136-909(+)
MFHDVRNSSGIGKRDEQNEQQRGECVAFHSRRFTPRRCTHLFICQVLLGLVSIGSFPSLAPLLELPPALLPLFQRDFPLSPPLLLSLLHPLLLGRLSHLLLLHVSLIHPPLHLVHLLNLLPHPHAFRLSSVTHLLPWLLGRGRHELLLLTPLPSEIVHLPLLGVRQRLISQSDVREGTRDLVPPLPKRPVHLASPCMVYLGCLNELKLFHQRCRPHLVFVEIFPQRRDAQARGVETKLGGEVVGVSCFCNLDVGSLD